MVGNLVIIPKEKKCEYCKEEIESVNQIAKINYPDKNFCCLGCVEKWEEKQKKKPETMGDFLLQDTVKNIKNQNEKTIVSLREEIAGLWKENEALKAENKMLETLACNRSDEITDLKAKLFSAKNNYDKLYNEYFATGKYITTEAEIDELRKEIEKLQIDKKYKETAYTENLNIIRKDTAEAKLEKRELTEQLKTVHLFVQAAMKIEEKQKPITCLLKEIENILNNPVDSGLNQ